MIIIDAAFARWVL